MVGILEDQMKKIIKTNNMSKRKLAKFVLSSGREIDLDEMMAAMEYNMDEIHWFFNSATGGIESYSEDYPSHEQFEKDMEKIKNNKNIYSIPTLESWKSYKFMESFNEDVVKSENNLMHKKLLIALDGKGAFRKFKDVLHDDGELLEKWYKYKDEQFIKEASDWLKSLDIKFKIIQKEK